VQGGVADDFAIHMRQQRQVPAEVYVPAPIPDDFGVRHPVFDEHALGLRDGQEKLMKRFFIVFAQWPQFGFGAILELDVFGELLEFKF
jgi:hypothetical protein